MRIEEKQKLAQLRRWRTRKKVVGTAERPRMSVFKSSKNVYVQVIDDVIGKTLVSASSFEKGNHRQANLDVCRDVGRVVAERCKKSNIDRVVFDRNGSRYHGRVKAIAEAAREAGITF